MSVVYLAPFADFAKEQAVTAGVVARDRLIQFGALINVVRMRQRFGGYICHFGMWRRLRAGLGAIYHLSSSAMSSNSMGGKYVVLLSTQPVCSYH